MAVEAPVVPTATAAAQSPILGRWLRLGWPLYLALGLLLGAYLGINQRIDNPNIAVWKPFVWEYSGALVLVALIPLIVRLERRFPVDARPRRRIIAAHIAGVIVFSAVLVASMVALRKLVYALAGESYHFGNVPVRAFYEFQKDLIVYMIVLLAAFAEREFRVRRAGEQRAVRLSAELANAQLRHLTAQIDPHFLFNALNAISNRMHEDVESADRMISHLGDLLRGAFQADEDFLVPLGRELAWLRDYAAMMVARYRGQLAFRLDVGTDLEDVRVPRLLLQPIVENAFRHGLGEGRGSLSVEVRREGACVCYTISDDGVGFSGAPANWGTGLSNVSRRLQLLFGEDHELSFARRAARGTIVTVRFPVPA